MFRPSFLMSAVLLLAASCATIQKGELEAAETAVGVVVADLASVTSSEYANGQAIVKMVKEGRYFEASSALLAMYERLKGTSSSILADITAARTAVGKLFTNDDATRMQATEQIVGAPASVAPAAK